MDIQKEYGILIDKVVAGECTVADPLNVLQGRPREEVWTALLGLLSPEQQAELQQAELAALELKSQQAAQGDGKGYAL